MATKTFSTLLKTLATIHSGMVHPSAIFTIHQDTLTLLAVSKIKDHIIQENLPRQIVLGMDRLKQYTAESGKVYKVEDESSEIPEFYELLSLLEFREVTFLPLPGDQDQDIQGLVAIGTYEAQSLTDEIIEPFLGAIQLANLSLQQEDTPTPPGLSSLDTAFSAAIHQAATSSTSHLESLISVLHEQVKNLIGSYEFVLALYDEKTQSIRIPFLHEEGRRISTETIPVGEGLTSIVLRTKQPLLLNEDTEKQAEALGAKIIGKPAKSWLGVPLLLGNETIGAIILQDIHKENAFREEDLNLLSSISQQVAGFLYNALLLEDTHNQLLQMQTTAEIARDISSARNLDDLLLKSVNLIRERLHFYHAGIFLIDNSGTNAVIREASGEAGAQMKRTNHALEVGSKSIVGFVAGKGESLVVNDTANDATHLPNPMLPDTRAEAALPIKIGDRILGVLDVQSASPFSFSPDEIYTLQLLADQLAIAVSNTELFAETQEHLSQHRLLHHITTTAASGATLDDALEKAVEGLQVTLGGDRVSILMADAEQKNLVTRAWVGYSEEMADITVPYGSGITGWVASHRKPLRIDDVTQDARYIEISPNTRSELAIPLLFRGEILGVLNVESEQTHAYDTTDEEMLGTLAGSLAAIIANARLVEQIRKQAERERLLFEITSKIRRSTDMQSILATTTSEISRITGAQKTQISVGIDKDQNLSPSQGFTSIEEK